MAKKQTASTNTDGDEDFVAEAIETPASDRQILASKLVSRFATLVGCCRTDSGAFC